ncbi:MAG: hypothetical protein OER97_01590 [Gammaproteobacteria bacterium]|nr:hypothetical protein [Gammaproteobacteria bacterium]
MTIDPNNQVLRLRKKHAPGGHIQPDVADGARLVDAQSTRHALIAALIVVILFAAIWAMLSVALGRVFPWLTLLLGYLLGYAVRRGGQGVDWRFPVLAAAFAFVGSIFGNIVVAAAYTAGEFETGTFTILRNVTTYTWPVFFDEVMTAADFVFAFCSAGIAAYFANRRLTRREYQAVRIWQERFRDD